MKATLAPMSADPSIAVSRLSDAALRAAHDEVHHLKRVQAAMGSPEIEAHHLIADELRKRGLPHPADDDGVHNAVVTMSRVRVPLATLAKMLGPVEVQTIVEMAVANGTSFADVYELLTANGWMLRAEPAAPSDDMADAPEDTPEPEDLLQPRQTALYEGYERIVEQFGKFDQSSGPNGAHYMADNPFVAEGLACANCVFYEGGQGCELVSGQIAPDAICKLWVIDASLLKIRALQPRARSDESGNAASKREKAAGSFSPPLVPSKVEAAKHLAGKHDQRSHAGQGSQARLDLLEVQLREATRAYGKHINMPMRDRPKDGSWQTKTKELSAAQTAALEAREAHPIVQAKNIAAAERRQIETARRERQGRGEFQDGDAHGDVLFTGVEGFAERQGVIFDDSPFVGPPRSQEVVRYKDQYRDFNNSVRADPNGAEAVRAQQSYTHDSRPINGKLLGLSNDPGADRDIESLDAAIARHGVPAPNVMMRGARAQVIEELPEMELQPGDTFTDVKFGSWTTNGDTARKFASGGGDTFTDEGGIPERFATVSVVKNGSAARGIPGADFEMETILPRNTNYRVTNVTDVVTTFEGGPGRVRFLELEIVP